MVKYAIFMISVLLSFNAFAQEDEALETNGLDYGIEQDNSDVEEYAGYSEQYEGSSENEDYEVKDTYEEEDY